MDIPIDVSWATGSQLCVFLLIQNALEVSQFGFAMSFDADEQGADLVKRKTLEDGQIVHLAINIQEIHRASRERRISQNTGQSGRSYQGTAGILVRIGQAAGGHALIAEKGHLGFLVAESRADGVITRAVDAKFFHDVVGGIDVDASPPHEQKKSCVGISERIKTSRVDVNASGMIFPIGKVVGNEEILAELGKREPQIAEVVRGESHRGFPEGGHGTGTHAGQDSFFYR